MTNERRLNMTHSETNTQTPHMINYQAVQRYKEYFTYLLNHFTFELRLLNDQPYYTFSSLPFNEWQESLYQGGGSLEATQFLDKLQIERINGMTVKSFRDVTATVREQYTKQKEIIFCSFELVEKIMQHAEKRIVRDAIRLIEKSRANTESKRRYWRALNEHYYGLDIHPLMEYEVDELERILYACEHYEENPNYAILSWVLGATIVLVGGAAISHAVLQIIP